MFAHRPVAPLQVGTTAVLIAWRAARYRVILVAGLNLLGGAAPVTTAWLGKLLLNEVSLGQAADLRRSAALAVASGIMASVTVALLQAASYVHSSVRRSITLLVADELYTTVNSIPDMRLFEDPEFHGRLALAQQAAQDVPQDTLSFLLDLAQSTIRVAGYTAALLTIWPPMAFILALAAIPEVVVQQRLAGQFATTDEGLRHTERRAFFYRSLLTDVRAVKEIRLFDLRSLFHTRMLTYLGDSTAGELAVQRAAPSSTPA